MSVSWIGTASMPLPVLYSFIGRQSVVAFGLSSLSSKGIITLPSVLLR